MKFTGPVPKVGGFIGACVDTVVFIVDEPELTLDPNKVDVSVAGLGAETLAVDGVADVLVAADEEGSGRLENGLKRGLSSW